MKRIFAALLAKRKTLRLPEGRPTAPPATYEFALSTVSLNSNFDAYLSIGFPGFGSSVELLVDSGNSTLIVPRWEDIQTIPGYEAKYQILGQATEPWGCPANVVKGPIEMITTSGETLTIADCIFYACTGESPSDQTRTANFGAGCLAPWSASVSNVPAGLGVTMQAPLSYSSYPIAEFDYAPASEVHQGGANATVSASSILRLYRAVPDGYQMFDIVPNCEWMSLLPKSLRIEGTLTGWPGNVASPIAMIDTGGGPVYLSDPNNYLYAKQWPDSVPNPDWASSSICCQSSQAALRVEIGDDNRTYAYAIDVSSLPAPARGLTLVICEKNDYMMGQQGMNIGGISALANYILVDLIRKQVGFKKK